MKNVFLAYVCNDKEKYYASLMKDNLESYGVRVYEANHTNITVDIYNSIDNCDLLVAFLTAESFNVGFEVGYAIGRSKKVLIVTDGFDKIPFDLKLVPCLDLHYSLDNPFAILKYIDKVESSADETDNNGIKDFDRLLLSYHENPTCLDQIKPKEFENLIFDWLEQKRLKVTRAEIVDSGYDFLITDYRGFSRTLMEVKKYNINNKVSVGILLKFLGVLHYYKADHGIFFTSSSYTQSAMDFAENANPKIELWDMKSNYGMK